MNFGRISREPAHDYFTSGAVGSNALKVFRDSPLLFKRTFVTGEALSEEKEAFRFGTLAHTVILEPAAVEFCYVVSPRFDRRTKLGRESAEIFEAQAAGRIVVDKEDMDLAERLRDSVMAKHTCRDLFSSGEAEVTFRQDAGDGLALQCRADWFNETPDEYRRPTIVDLKTVEHISDFARQFHNYGYWLQAPLYQMVVASVLGLTGYAPRFVFVVVEKSEPFDCAIFQPDEASLHHGLTEVKRLVSALREAKASNIWPGQPDAIQNVSLPEWLLAKGE